MTPPDLQTDAPLAFDLGEEMKHINEAHDIARRLARAQFAIEILTELAAHDGVGGAMTWLIEMCRKEAE